MNLLLLVLACGGCSPEPPEAEPEPGGDRATVAFEAETADGPMRFEWSSEEGRALAARCTRDRRTWSLDPASPWIVDGATDATTGNLDEDPEPEVVIVAPFITGAGPGGAKPFRAAIALDCSPDGLVRLPLVEQRLGQDPDQSSIDALMTDDAP